LEGNEFGIDPGTSHAFKLNVCPSDYAGQAETADGGAEQVGIVVGTGIGTAEHQTVVRAMQSDLADVSTEGSSAMMVLTVHVIGDGSTYSDEAGAGRDGKEPSFGKKNVDDVGEAHAAFAAKHAGGFVETEDTVETGTVDQFAVGVETGIAVAAAEAIRKQRTGRGSLEKFRYLVAPCGFVDVMMHGLRVAAPRENSPDRRRCSGLFA